MKKIISCCLAAFILCNSFFINPVSASSTQESHDEVNIYDGIYHSEDVTIEQIMSLTEAQRVVLREDEDVLVSIVSEVRSMNNSSDSSQPSTFADIPSNEITSSLTVKRNSDGSQLTFSLYVDWERVPSQHLKDKIAISWSGGDALLVDSCRIRSVGSGSYDTSTRCSRSTVTPAQGISYDIDTNSQDLGYLLNATISNKNDGDEYKNFVGAFAHKTFGLSNISVGFSSSGISFSTGFGTSFDQMEPVYSVYM